MPSASVTATWDKPLKLHWAIDSRGIGEAMAKRAPWGRHTHDKIMKYHYSKPGFPRTGGSLRRELRKPRNFRVSDNQTELTLEINLPYARIVDQGGTIPAVSGKWMLWRSGGTTKLRRSRRGYTIKGKDYVSKGFADWSGKSSNIKVSWL